GLELLGVGEIAVVPEHDAERGVDVKRLRLGRRPRGACSRIARVGDAGLPHQQAYIARAEYIAHHPGAFVSAEVGSFRRHDPRSVLAAVLQHEQPVIEQLVDWILGDDSDYSAHRVPSVPLKDEETIPPYPMSGPLRRSATVFSRLIIRDALREARRQPA